MAEQVGSKRWKLGPLDWHSIWRHTAYPLVAGAAQAAYEAWQAGICSPEALARVALVAVLSGAARLAIAGATDSTIGDK